MTAAPFATTGAEGFAAPELRVGKADVGFHGAWVSRGQGGGWFSRRLGFVTTWAEAGFMAPSFRDDKGGGWFH